jgi:hypothetical protein
MTTCVDVHSVTAYPHLMKIKVMTDYDCAPLWWDSSDGVGDIRPEDLPLSDGLRRDLWNWQATYDAILVRDDPRLTAFPSEAAEQAFENQGRRLTERVANELGPSVAVRYWRDI